MQSSWRKGRQPKICSVSWKSKNPPPRPRPPPSRISLLLRRDRRDLFAPHRAIPPSAHLEIDARDRAASLFSAKQSIVHDPRRTMGRRLLVTAMVARERRHVVPSVTRAQNKAQSPPGGRQSAFQRKRWRMLSAFREAFPTARKSLHKPLPRQGPPRSTWQSDKARGNFKPQ